MEMPVTKGQAFFLICCVVFVQLVQLPFVAALTFNGPNVLQAYEYPRTKIGDLLGELQVRDTASGRDNTVVVSLDQETKELVGIYLNRTDHLNDVNVSIYANTRLDRDYANPTPTLQFQATDGIDTRTRSITLYILDVNDNSPSFDGEPYTTEIHENETVSSNVFNATASDPDTGVGGLVSYSMKPKTQSNDTAKEYNQTFQINSITGQVTLLKKLDYETNTFYQFSVMAKDGGTETNATTTSLIIRVLDVQDTPPVFEGEPYRKAIDENQPIGTTVLKVTARDGDTGISNKIEYSLNNMSECADMFAIGNSTGEITTQMEIDRDEGVVAELSGSCVLEVLAKEGDEFKQQNGQTNSSTLTTVTIEVKDVNDNSPKFNSDTYTASVPENTPATVPIDIVGQINVTDKDQGDRALLDISLQYPNGTKCTDFTVSPKHIQSSGLISIRVENQDLLDYETIQEIIFQIKVTERANESHTDIANVTLKVEDVNDNSPEFNKTTYTVNITENLPNGTLVTTLTATDEDPHFGNITYELLGDAGGRFAVDNKTGSIITTCQQSNCSKDLDRETISSFYITIKASDDGGRTNVALLIINLNDENDNSPRFMQPFYTVSVDEGNSSCSYSLLTVSATDVDRGENQTVAYRLRDSHYPGNFTVHNETGEIRVHNCLDYENITRGDNGTISLVVEAYDGGTPQKNTTVNVTVNVRDLNDNTPTFKSNSYSGNVTENSKHGTHVRQVSATDADGSLRNSKISFFILEGSDKFKVNSSTGEVSVQLNADLDRETKPFYNVTIVAIDQGDPNPLTGTATLSVAITDVNDEPPVFIGEPYQTETKENTTNPGLIYTCNATDSDENYHLNYSIIRLTARDENQKDVNSTLVEGYFRINSSTGAVYQNGKTDREVAQTIELTLQVQDMNADNSSQPQIDTATLTITLLDINDNAPVFDNPNYNVSVAENARNITLTTISATDRDENRTMLYLLKAGPSPISSFYINNATGVLQKAGPLDREKNETVTLTVIAEDNGVPPMSSSIQVYVTVEDFNDNAPQFQHHNTSYSISENVAVNTTVVTLTATDVDAEQNGHVTYFLEGGQDQFIINEQTGEIKVNARLDREKNARYTLTVTAKDNPVEVNSQRTNSTTIDIILKDENDNPPVFKPCCLKAEVQENAEIGREIVVVSAQDADAGDNALVSYSIDDIRVPAGIDAEHLFQVNEGTGELLVNSSLLNKLGVYNLTIVAQDHGSPSLNGTTVVQITVTDVNNHKPVLGNLPINGVIEVYECTRIGSVIWTFNASDEDRGMNAKVNFTFISLDDIAANISLDATNGSLVVNGSLDVNVKEQYHYQIIARDNGPPPGLTSEPKRFTLKLLDVDNHLPTFRTNKYNMSVVEEAIGEVVGTVTATDEDKDSDMCYTISGSSQYFEISRKNGTIWTKGKLDREKFTSTSITVNVNRCSIAPINSSFCDNKTDVPQSNIPNVTVNISITDVNDNPPRFTVNEISFGMRRNVEQGSTLELQLKTDVTDNDTRQNGYDVWMFRNNGNIQVSDGLQGKVSVTDGTNACSDGVKHVICINGNGSVVNNKWFNEDVSGYLEVPVMVQDEAGNDTAIIKIFLIGDSQVLLMTLVGLKSQVALKKNEILDLFSEYTGYKFVYDKLEDHKSPTGIVDLTKTDLYFHVVDPSNNKILSAEEAKRIIDQTTALGELKLKFNVVNIMQSQSAAQTEEDSKKTFYTMIAVIVLLSLSIIIVGYAFFSSVSRYKRKLKAATVASFGGTDKAMEMGPTSNLNVPGSNQYAKMSNPLLNSKFDDLKHIPADQQSLSSNNSIDVNEVDGPRPEQTYDTIEEREVTMDMFGEDMFVEDDSEDPLEAALKAHEQTQITRNAARHSDYADDNGDVANGHANGVAIGFVNGVFDDEDFESTEI